MYYKILWYEAPDNVQSALYAKDISKYTNITIDTINVFDVDFTVESNKAILKANEIDIVEEYDALIIRSCVPYISETITIARMFYKANKVVIDQSMVDEGFAMSKMHDYLILSKFGINIPNTKQINNLNQANDFIIKNGYPCILKGNFGSSGNNVFKINNFEDLEKIFFQFKPGKLLIQKFLVANEDYKVMVIGYEASPKFAKRIPPNGDFFNNDHYEDEIIPTELADFPVLKNLAEQCAKILRIESCSVDIRFHDNVAYVLEANRRPNLLGYKNYVGYDAGLDLIKYTVKRIDETKEKL